MTPWNVLISFAYALPWLLIAIAAGLALLKRKSAPPLILQLLGAAGTLIAYPIRALITALLTATHAPVQAHAAAGYIMTFFTFLFLLLFAIGYAWEKLARK
jgi:xanthosine utilization system XapX-like protein